MKPWLHARSSVKRWGGTPQDYIAIHDFFDSSKAHVPDMRHRAILHSSFGIYIAERVFGHNIEISTGATVSVRDIGEHHVIEDMGRIPTVQDYLDNLPWLDWLGGQPKRKQTVMSLNDSKSLQENNKIELDTPVFDTAPRPWKQFKVVD